MAGCCDGRFLWTICVVIIRCEFALSSNTSSVYNDISISLKRCCWSNLTQGNDGDENSCSDFQMTENMLRSYGILKSDGALPVVQDTNSILFQDTLSCKDVDGKFLQLSVPVLKEPGVKISSSDLYSYFSQDGQFHYDGHTFFPEEYCIESIIPDMIKVVACDYKSPCSYYGNNVKNTNKRPCVYRCCNEGEVWDIAGEPNQKCAYSGEKKWKLQQYYNLSSNELVTFESAEIAEEPTIFSLHPRELLKTCKTNDYTFQITNPRIHTDKRFQGNYGDQLFKVLADGTVWMKLRILEWVQLKPGEYCVDGFQVGNGTYSGDDVGDVILFECKVLETAQEVEGRERQRNYTLIFGIIIIFCLLFLLMTTIVYILLWSKHNIHGWTVFSYITTLLITYLLLGASHLASVFMFREHTQGKLAMLTFCGLLGILCHFSFLCTFSWSTVLSFDLFCTFRTLRPRRNGKSNGLKKFLLYCLFAFMIPAAIVTVGIVLDVIYSMDAGSDVITPSYGKPACYVEPRYARVYFVILPIAVFLSINFALFCNTAFSVYKVKKSTRFASSNSTKKEEKNQTLRLILKLLLVNGAVWVVEIISWSFQEDHEKVGLVSFILDVVNVLQAVAIFFLFVFKNDILESLKRKYPCLESTVNFAFKLKNFGVLQRSSENNTTATTTTTGTSINVKVNDKKPVSTL